MLRANDLDNTGASNDLSASCIILNNTGYRQ